MHTLATSYSNLFVNVDKVIDRNGYLNDGPLFVKIITLSGLNLEDAPCLELWDASGLTYTSHNGWHADASSCSWNTESGEGFFKISQFIIGDFSIVCRFGGHLANTKNKSTLIFKYQNSTGTVFIDPSYDTYFLWLDYLLLYYFLLYSVFLSDEVIDLRHSDVDINPQYSESIDIELLRMHLMLESDPALIGQEDSSAKESLLPPFARMGLEAFEAGLDEVFFCNALLLICYCRNDFLVFFNIELRFQSITQ